MLRRAWAATVADSLPGSLKVTVFGTGVELGGARAGAWDMSEVLRLADEAAGEAGKRVWLLFDNLDELLAVDRRRRLKALSALFTVCNQLRASYPNLQPRIFLRTDIWSDVDFNNKSHWVGKGSPLTWSDEQLLRLILKRLTGNDALRTHMSARVPSLSGADAVDELSVAQMRTALTVVFERCDQRGRKRRLVALDARAQRRRARTGPAA